MKFPRTGLAVLALAVAGGSALADDVAPTPEQKAAVEGALTAAGFTSWSKIELDDGKWEVDDVIHADGKRYDVELAVADLKVIKQELDTD